MKSDLYQWNYKIDGLIPRQVRLKRKIWLRKGEILLDKKGDELIAYQLGNSNESFNEGNELIPYLWMSCLITNNGPELSNKGGCSISSQDELGTKPIYSSSFSTSIPDEAVCEIEKHAYKFLSFIGKLHDKYISIINQNSFLTIALDYFHDAEKKFVYSDEGFISVMISLEALFNEGGSDIKYKLAHRASFLLGICGIDSVEAFGRLQTFYNYRSTLLHGRGAIPDDPDRYQAAHYTRKAIIIFLILLNNEERQKTGKDKRKKAILNEIDCAMLDANKLKLLKSEIKKGLKDFKLNVPRTFEGLGKNGKYRITAW